MGDQIAIYIIAEDSFGYVHKTLVHYWMESENESMTETLYDGERIYDKDGNLLYGDEDLWG